MNWLGHYGVGLLVATPLVGALARSGFEDLAVLCVVGMLALTRLPDVDRRVPVIAHRGPTHSIAFALAVGGATAAGGWWYGLAVGASAQRILGTVGFVLGTLAIVAHLLADVVTPMGVPLFWPLSNRSHTLAIVRSDDVLANVVCGLVGSVAVGHVLLQTRSIPGV